MVIRYITQGYTDANVLEWYQRILTRTGIYQARITSELCYHGLNSHKINVHKEGHGSYPFQSFVQYIDRYCSDKFPSAKYILFEMK